MDFASLAAEKLALWIKKGVCSSRLESRDLWGDVAFPNAIQAAGIGLTAAAAIQFLAIKTVAPKLPVTQFFTEVAIGGATLDLALLLMVLLRVLQVKVRLLPVLSLCLFVFSGLEPVLALLSVVQTQEAVRLFIEVGDPNRPYFRSATVSLLMDGNASTSYTVRAWLSFAAELGFAVYYLFFGLLRNLVKHLGVQAARGSVAVVGALSIHIAFVQLLYGRAFWWLIKIALENTR